MHFTPTSGSWLNLVEVWFGIITRQAIRRGTFRSVKDLNAKIRAFIDGWNDDAPPVRLDQDRRRNPHESQPSNDFELRPLALQKNYETGRPSQPSRSNALHRRRVTHRTSRRLFSSWHKQNWCPRQDSNLRRPA